MDYKVIVAEKLSKLVDMDVEAIEKLIELPPKGDMGDYAFPCFQLAKVMRKAPPMIAAELKNSMDMEGFEKIENVGPYINFFVDKSIYTKKTLDEILEKGHNYGSSSTGKGKNVIVEYSSPNIAKPFHIGHLSTTVIGHSLYRILKFQGYNCIGINHLGDWGTQFGRLIAAYHRWVDREAFLKSPIEELQRIYVKFYQEAEKDPSLEDTARMHFKRLEDGCEEEVSLWKEFKELSLEEFQRVYNILNITFDSFAGESFYGDKMEAVVEEIESKGLLTDSNGAKVVMLDEYNMPPCIIKKSDGATIYATRDLAAAMYRKNTYDFYKNIYVVGSPQALHFKQIFTTLKLMDHEWAEDCIHIGFGLVKFANTKFSSRSGNVILLEELLKTAAEEELVIINEKSPDLENKEDVAQKIGVGAIVFAYLKNNREKDIIFDWKEMLSFEGETGPYVQYTYARGKSILRKVGDINQYDLSLLSSPEEFELIKILSSFRDAIKEATDRYEPFVITRYSIDVAKAFNKFYNHCNIMNTEDEKLKGARVKLVEATCHVLKNALYLIGLDVVEKM